MSDQIPDNDRVANIQAPTEEMKAFSAGLRVGYKKGFEAGYAEGLAPQVQPSEVLFNKPETPRPKLLTDLMSKDIDEVIKLARKNKIT